VPKGAGVLGSESLAYINHQEGERMISTSPVWQWLRGCFCGLRDIYHLYMQHTGTFPGFTTAVARGQGHKRGTDACIIR